MSEYTPEPWRMSTSNDNDCTIWHKNNICVAQHVRESDARRIVACVNACADMDDPAKEVAALRAQVEDLTARIDKACSVMDDMESVCDWPIYAGDLHEIRAALAATGKEV